jgi:hypothetical protein
MATELDENHPWGKLAMIKLILQIMTWGIRQGAGGLECLLMVFWSEVAESASKGATFSYRSLAAVHRL